MDKDTFITGTNHCEQRGDEEEGEENDQEEKKEEQENKVQIHIKKIPDKNTSPNTNANSSKKPVTKKTNFNDLNKKIEQIKEGEIVR